MTPPPPPGYHYRATPPPVAPVAPSGSPLAEYGDRALAFIIDYAILTAIAIALSIPVYAYQFSVMDDIAARLNDRLGDPAEQPDLLAVYGEMLRALAPIFAMYGALVLLLLGVFYIYRVEAMFRTGQTIGKRVMKLRVIPLDPALGLTRGMAVRRWLIDSVGGVLVPLLFWIDGLWQYWDRPYRQCLHDKVAGTTVVKVGP